MKKEFPEKRSLIIFTGGPGTGKSSTMQRFLDYLENDENVKISYDQIKERNWDRFGFDNLQQKNRLDWWSLEEFYLTIQKNMWENRTIFIEYPFYQRHKPELEKLVLESGYLAVTVFLYADLRTVYERGKRRDLLDDRHPGHLLNSYHKETYRTDMLTSISQITLSYNAFAESIADKIYNVELGLSISLEVLDFSAVNYAQLYGEITAYQI